MDTTGGAGGLGENGRSPEEGRKVQEKEKEDSSKDASQPEPSAAADDSAGDSKKERVEEKVPTECVEGEAKQKESPRQASPSGEESTTVEASVQLPSDKVCEGALKVTDSTPSPTDDKSSHLEKEISTKEKSESDGSSYQVSNGASSNSSTNSGASNATTTTTSTYLSGKRKSSEYSASYSDKALSLPRGSDEDSWKIKSSDASPTTEGSGTSIQTKGSSTSTSSTSSSSFGSFLIGTPSGRSTSSSTTTSTSSGSTSSTSTSMSSRTASSDARSASTRDTGLSQETGSDKSSTTSSVQRSISRHSDDNDRSQSSSKIESYESNGSNGSGYLSSIESNTGSPSPPREDDSNGRGSGNGSHHSNGADDNNGDLNGNRERNGTPDNNGSHGDGSKDSNGNDQGSSSDGENGNGKDGGDSNGDNKSQKSDDTLTESKDNSGTKSIAGSLSSSSSSSFHISHLFKTKKSGRREDTKSQSENGSSGSYKLNLLYSPQGSGSATPQAGEKESSEGSVVGLYNLFASSGGGSESSSVRSGSDGGSLGSYGRSLFRSTISSSSRSGSSSLGSYGRKLFSSFSSDSSGKDSDKASLGSHGRKLFRGSSSESSGKASDISSFGSYCRKLFSTPSIDSSSGSSVNGSKPFQPSNGSSIGRKSSSKSSSSSVDAPSAGIAVLSSVNGKSITSGVSGSSTHSSGSNGLSWITITPAQSPIQPIMEVFPPPQVPLMFDAQTPQTPLISTITPPHMYMPEPEPGHPEEADRGTDQDEAMEEIAIIERTDSLDTVLHKPYHDSSTTMGSSSDNLDVSEHQPLLDSTDSGVDHTFFLPGPEAAVHRASPKESIASTTRPMRSTLPPPQTSSYLISPSGIVTNQGHPLGSPTLGHSSGLVSLHLSGPQDSIASYPLAGQGLLTTVQSIDYPSPPIPCTQPVLAPLQLPQQVLASPVAVADSALMGPTKEDLPPLSPPAEVEVRAIVPCPDVSDRPLTGDVPPMERRVLEDVPEATPTRPSRNLHLDLGWVWGQDATKMQVATRPKRHRIRRAQAMPISPHVGPLSSDMDTADSGLGTADGDMMFGAPYPSELPTSADITANTQTNFMLSDKWKSLFDKYDPEGHGEVSVDNFRSLLEDARFRSQVAPHKLEVLENLAGNGRTTVTYHDLVSIMSNKRRRSFTIAVHCRDREVASESDFQLEPPPPSHFARMVRRIAKEFLTDERDRQYYADHYTCWPPPLFVPTVTLIEIGFFVYYCIEAGDIGPSSPVPANSMFIYRPDKRIEIWRFFFYMLIHAGWVHLFFNMLVQLLVGIPLEMVHGSFRIGTVYMAGVLAGSLGTSVFDMDAFLVGASGGVYALLAAHLANILLNYSEMELGIFKLVAVFMIASADVGFAIWDRYSNEDAQPPVGYVSHLMGALAGLTIGLLVLKNFQQKLHAQILWWIALGVYSICTVFAILWNIFYY